ncbi:MAG: PEFG-CTERM sorting domain-containing protein [Nitrosotalea sp.]
MINNMMKSIFLLTILVLGFSGNVGMFEKSNNHTSSVSHVMSIISVPLAFAESDGEKDSGSSDKSSGQDNSNNTAGNESPSSSEHQSENNGLQFNESNQTQTMHGGENKDQKELDQESENKTTTEHQQESENKTTTEHQQESENKTTTEHQQESENKTTTEHQQELDQESEIKNENNNINATHKMTEQDLSNIEGAKANETIAAEINVGIGNVEHKSIDNNVMVQTANVTNNSVAITVNASSGTGPKVILINLNSTTIDVSSINSMHVLYDGHPITPAANIDEIMHSTSSDPPRYAILITQSGAQILISIPHFSTHTITLTNMSQVIPAVPEFPLSVIVVFALMITAAIAIARKRLNLFS